MDQRTQNVINDIENNRLSIDSTFEFRCLKCGKCCNNRKDILLTAKDLYNIAKHLGRTINQIAKRYCDVYIGDSSRIPIVRLKPTGTENACPLLRNKRCVVHSVKPTVCALFPLGRVAAMSQDNDEAETSGIIRPQYFLQPVKCGSHTQINTVRSWLEKSGVPVEDEFYLHWSSAIMYLANFFIDLEEHNTDHSIMDYLWNITYVLLYIHFNTDSDFMSQFRKRIPELKAVLAKLMDKTKTLAGGASDGE